VIHITTSPVSFSVDACGVIVDVPAGVCHDPVLIAGASAHDQIHQAMTDDHRGMWLLAFGVHQGSLSER
jgi:hypothetical protein